MNTRQTDRKQENRWTDRQRNKSIKEVVKDRQLDRIRDRQTDRQMTNRQTERQRGGSAFRTRGPLLHPDASLRSFSILIRTLRRTLGSRILDRVIRGADVMGSWASCEGVQIDL